MRHYFALAIPALLAGCAAQTPVPMPVTRRPVVQVSPSAMSAADTVMRRSFTVITVPASGAFYYRPVARCYFAEHMALATGGTADRNSTISVKSVRTQLLITATAGTGAAATTSTVLIDSTGRLQDYNIVDMISGRRTTPESFAADTRRRFAEMRAKYGTLPPGAHVLKGQSWLPQFAQATASPGDTVGILPAEDGSAWARYIYRGTMLYRGSVAAVVDLMRVFDSQPGAGPVLIGYSVINLRTMLPMLHVFSAGSTYRMEQLTCS